MNLVSTIEGSAAKVADKSMIVAGGENVCCKEVEDVIAAIPAIAQDAGLGLPHPEWGEPVAAAVVLNPGATLDPAGLTAALRRRIAACKMPRRLMVAGTLPRTPTGKAMEHVLRDVFVDAPALQQQDD